jgi:hypothetical protein
MTNCWNGRDFVRAAFVLWLITTLSYGYIHPSHFDNEMAISRLDLLHSIVSDNTLSIDAYQANTLDKAVAHSHYYCDKAPCTAALALPGFYLSSIVLHTMGIPLESKNGWLVSGWICVATSVGLITALGMVCLFLWLSGFVSRRWALISTLAVAFGSMAFPYATMLMSHALVVGLFSIALYCLQLGWHRAALNGPSEDRRLMVRDLVAGTACGMAIASEYSVALVAGGILITVSFSSWRRALYVILGAIPPLLLIPVYDWICLGNPFTLTYSHEAVFTQNEHGFYGIHLPSLNNLFELLLSPRQGLFFWTPFLLLAFVGFPILYAKSRSLFWLCYVVPLIQELIMSGYYTIAAGNLLGSRFLAPILPLLILPASIGATKLPRIAVLLALASVALTGTATVIDAKLPAGDENPFFHFYVPQFLAGNFTYNLGEAIGLKGFLSIAPLLIVVSAGVWFLWRECAPARNETCSNAPVGAADEQV